MKISLRWALYVQSIKVWAKKYRLVIFHDIEQWCKIWRNPDLVLSKMAWWIGWTFIKPVTCLENCTLMGLFCLKHIMFQIENFRGFEYWQWRMIKNLKRNWLVSKLNWVIWRLLTQTLESLKHLDFNGLLVTEVYTVWAKKVQVSYVWPQWRLHLEENWLLLSKMTWRI